MKTLNQQLKTLLIEESKRHRLADELMQGAYFKGTIEKPKLCAVGCAIFTLNQKRGKEYDCGDHSVYPKEFGVPEQLAHLQDKIFEYLPKEKAMFWPERFWLAMPVETDISLVIPHFFVWLMEEMKQYAKEYPDVLSAISQVQELYKREIKKENIENKEWHDAADATRYAAYAADAARYAAYAADAADAARYAAEDTSYEKMADKLIEILEGI